MESSGLCSHCHDCQPIDTLAPAFLRTELGRISQDVKAWPRRLPLRDILQPRGFVVASDRLANRDQLSCRQQVGAGRKKSRVRD